MTADEKAVARVEAILELPSEPNAIVPTADLRRLVALAKRCEELERRIEAAGKHLERAIEWEPRPVAVVRGDAQLARHALRKPLPRRKKR